MSDAEEGDPDQVTAAIHQPSITQVQPRINLCTVEPYWTP